MAESKIEWTDYTFNPWRGCTKVSPGCANCYADTLSKRNPSTLGVWGPNGNRVVAAEYYWKLPLKWDREAAAAGVRRRVFCASLADVFEEWQGPIENASGCRLLSCDGCGKWYPDDDASDSESCDNAKCGRFKQRMDWLTMDGARIRLFGLIRQTPNLDWLLLTKRPENMKDFVYWTTDNIDGLNPGGNFPTDFPNVWLGVSIENQEQADKRIPLLLQTPAAVRFLSCEPLLGPVDLSRWMHGFEISRDDEGNDLGSASGGSDISWVIVGGESGHGARPMHPCWAIDLKDQCLAAGVPFFFKQWGEWKPYRAMTEAEGETLYKPIPEGRPVDSTRKCKVPTTSFTPHPMPRGGPCDLMFKLGKKLAGRQLDGRTWDEFPSVLKESD